MTCCLYVHHHAHPAGPGMSLCFCTACNFSNTPKCTLTRRQFPACLAIAHTHALALRHVQDIPMVLIIISYILLSAAVCWPLVIIVSPTITTSPHHNRFPYAGAWSMRWHIPGALGPYRSIPADGQLATLLWVHQNKQPGRTNSGHGPYCVIA